MQGLLLHITLYFNYCVHYITYKGKKSVIQLAILEGFTAYLHYYHNIYVYLSIDASLCNAMSSHAD
jgi:hypothetical protein